MTEQCWLLRGWYRMSLFGPQRYNMNNHLDLRRFLVALAIVPWLLAPASAQELSFTLVEQLAIGDDEEAPVEYLLSYPKLIRTDSKGNIYVHDRRRADVRVFDTSGRYVTTIGSRGEGPGEMQDIIGIHVDDQDRLIVADRISARFTIFTELGNSHETKAFEVERTIHPSPILSLEDSFVLKYVKSRDGPAGKRSVLHLHDAELNWLGSFAQLGNLFNLDIPFQREQSRVSAALKVATNGSDTIVLAHEVYGGYVYRYTRSNDTWVMDKLKGGPAPRIPYILVSERDFEANLDYRRAAIVGSSPEGIYRAKILNWSLGLVILANGEIVNFTMQTPLGDTGYTSAELFSQDGTLLGYGPLQLDDPELDGNKRVKTSISILWQDAAGRIYLRRENESGFYVLSVAELVVSPL